MFYKIQISTNFETIILKINVLSIAFARLCAIFRVVRERTCIKKGIKTCNFGIKLRICKMSIRFVKT